MNQAGERRTQRLPKNLQKNFFAKLSKKIISNPHPKKCGFFSLYQKTKNHRISSKIKEKSSKNIFPTSSLKIYQKPTLSS